MKINWLPLAAAVALAAGSVSASAVDFHGYFRAGAQLGTHGGEVYCLGNGNVGHKVGRLADECDTYGEGALSQEVYNKVSVFLSVKCMLSMTQLTVTQFGLVRDSISVKISTLWISII